MSYNILKKNVRFSGDSAGTIEGMVDTSSDQVISGSKDFESLTGSNALITGDLSVSNNISVQSITASAHVSSSFFYGDGSNLTGLTGVAGSAAGSNSQIQFNDGGSFSANSEFTFATGSSTLSVNTGSVEVLSASNYVSASTYYGDGSNLANITANSVNASKIIGQISGSQISASTGLTTDGNNLAVNLRANGGITDDSGLGLDAGDLSAYSSTYDDSYNIIISGSGAVKNRKVSLSWLESGIELNADRLTAGTINANRLPSEITASFSGTLARFGDITGSALTITGKSVLNDDITVAANKRIYLDGTGVSANQGPYIYGSANTMYIDGDDNMYLYHDSRMSIFHGSNRIVDINGGAITVDTTISSSNYISASAFIGDGSQLTNLPATSPAGANTQIQFNADGVFGASSKFTFATSSATLEIAKSTTTNNEAMIWFHSGSNPFGDGSGSFIHSDSDDDLIIDLNNETDRDIKFITRADTGAVQNKFIKLLIDGTATNKGVGIGNVSGMGIQDLYVSNTNLTSDTNVKFENRNLYDVILKLSSSTAETTLTNDRLTADFTLSHEGGDISLHSSNNLNLSASSNIGITGSTGLVAEFDSGNNYLFKARKLHYKEISFQLATSLTGSSEVWLPMGGTFVDSISQAFYHKFIAPFDGEIVKVMLRNDFAYNPSNYTLKAFKSSNSTEHPATEIDSGGLTFTLANTVKTVSYSTATFSAGDVLGFRLHLPGTFSPASSIGVNATIVIAYDELS